MFISYTILIKRYDRMLKVTSMFLPELSYKYFFQHVRLYQRGGEPVTFTSFSPIDVIDIYYLTYLIKYNHDIYLTFSSFVIQAVMMARF